MKRLSLDLTEEEHATIKAMAKHNKKSIVEMIRQALALYAIVMKNKEEGGDVINRKPNGTAERIVLL